MHKRKKTNTSFRRMRKVNIDILAAVWVLIMTLTGQAGAVTHYVWPGESIQAAIDDASDGDEIEVFPGTYYEVINFKNKAVRLYSSGGRDVTTIDANGADHVVQCASGEDANTILEGFTITGGNANGTYPDNCGGGMCNDDSSPTVIDCIFWGNWSDELFNNSSTPTITYSDVLGGHAGAGNIDADPCFVDAAAGNLRLKPDSPCIDAGDTTVVTLPLDLYGNPRAIDDPHTPNTGLSVSDSLNVVDMGVYEFDCEAIAGDNNCDGVVDFKDLAILCNNWLAGVEPEL
jgi:hypothetical protein